MGNIRTPKPVYFKQGVMIFYVKDKIIYYIVKLWTDDGFHQATVQEARLGTQNPQDIITKLTSQNSKKVIGLDIPSDILPSQKNTKVSE